MFSSSHISNFNKPRSSINNSFPIDKQPAENQQPVQKVHLKSVPQPNNSPENVQHKLQYRYNLWYSKRAPGKLGHINTESYDQTLKLLASFGTVEEFWKIYSYLIRPCDLAGFFEFHLFKEGIKPLWEDTHNINGGKWVLRLKKSVSSRVWENLVLAILGEQFLLSEEICGAVISTRSQEDFISIWNRTSNNLRIVQNIRDTLKRILNLPSNTVLQYKPHNERLMKDHTAAAFNKQNDSQQQPTPTTKLAGNSQQLQQQTTQNNFF